MANTASTTRTTTKTAASKGAQKTSATPLVILASDSAELPNVTGAVTMLALQKAYSATGKADGTLYRLTARLMKAGTTQRAIVASLGVSNGTVSNWDHAGQVLDRISEATGTYRPTIRDSRACLTVGTMNEDDRAKVNKKYPALSPTSKATGAAIAEAARAAADAKRLSRRTAARKAASKPRGSQVDPKDGATDSAPISKAAAIRAAGSTNESRAASAVGILAAIDGNVSEEQSNAITAQAERIAAAVAARITAEVAPKARKVINKPTPAAIAAAAQAKAKREADVAAIEAERIAATA